MKVSYEKAAFIIFVLTNGVYHWFTTDDFFWRYTQHGLYARHDAKEPVSVVVWCAISYC